MTLLWTLLGLWSCTLLQVPSKLFCSFTSSFSFIFTKGVGKYPDFFQDRSKKPQHLKPWSDRKVCSLHGTTFYLGTDHPARYGREQKPACCALLSSPAQTWWENPSQERIHIAFRPKTALSHWSGAPEAAGFVCEIRRVLAGRCCCSSVISPKSTGENQLSSGENSSKTQGKPRRAGSWVVISRPGRYGACLVPLAWKSTEGDLAATPLISGASGNTLDLYD